MEKCGSSKDKMLIKSYGGIGGLVTGSCHLLESRRSRVVIDCGLFQGPDEKVPQSERSRNLNSLSEIGKASTHMLITHAHIDHTGRVPAVYKEGFRPKLLATETTVAFMSPLLRNSADIQKSQKEKDRLYNSYDVETTLRHVKGVQPFREISVGQNNSNITAEFLLNGHVEGASSIFIRNYNNYENILFTGDMGKPVQSLCGGYTDFMNRYPKEPVHTLMIESTNFEKEPIGFEQKKEELLNTLQRVWDGGGNPLLPVLSFHRCQEIMEMIHNGQKNGSIPSDCQIIIDSPLAMEILDVYKKIGTECLSPRYGNNPRFYKTEKESLARFNLKKMTVVQSTEESKLLDREMANYKGKLIILAGGGMGSYGRSVNYLKGEFCKNPNNAVVYTCFQVKGTYGANMLYKKNHLAEKMVGAQVYKIEGFTSHISGPDETFKFIERFNLEDLQTIIIGHGNEASREKMEQEFIRRGYKTKIFKPIIGEQIIV